MKTLISANHIGWYLNRNCNPTPKNGVLQKNSLFIFVFNPFHKLFACVIAYSSDNRIHTLFWGKKMRPLEVEKCWLLKKTKYFKALSAE